jgi:hypothetical protein
MKMKKAFIITVSILSCVILVLGIYLWTTSNSLTATSASLENLYQRSFYELVNNVNNMEVNLSKLMVSNDSTSQQKILSSLKSQTSDAENSLSLLPLDEEVLTQTSDFMNQLNGYCTSLITYKDGTIENEDYETLSTVHTSLESIKTELNSIMEKIMAGYRISDNISGEGGGDFTISFSNFVNDTIDYPSLIYDGPFSESTTNKTVKGLSGDDIDEASAELVVENIFGDKITNLSLIDETSGKFETYNYGVSTADKNYYVQVTKQGGFLLGISANITETADTASQQDESTAEDTVTSDSVNSTDEATTTAVSIAQTFATNRGLENMECVWSASSDNICYVNLAPVVDDIVMYPDLVKVKVELSSGDIVGYEASSYATNHTERDDLVATITEAEAEALVSDNLQVDTTKLCVIPLDYVGETLAYEFAGEYDNYKYYLYVDAYSGDQVRVLRVIQTDEGELLI